MILMIHLNHNYLKDSHLKQSIEMSLKKKPKTEIYLIIFCFFFLYNFHQKKILFQIHILPAIDYFVICEFNLLIANKKNGIKLLCVYSRALRPSKVKMIIQTWPEQDFSFFIFFCNLIYVLVISVMVLFLIRNWAKKKIFNFLYTLREIRNYDKISFNGF